MHPQGVHCARCLLGFTIIVNRGKWLKNQESCGRIPLARFKRKFPPAGAIPTESTDQG